MPDRVQIQLVPIHEGEMAGWGSAQSKPDGSFQMLCVSDGDYALRVYGMEQGWYVRSARLGGEDVLEKGLQLEKGVTGTLEIVLSSSGAQLEGTVTDHDKPAGGAEVVAKPGARNALQPSALKERHRLRTQSRHAQRARPSNPPTHAGDSAKRVTGSLRFSLRPLRSLRFKTLRVPLEPPNSAVVAS